MEKVNKVTIASPVAEVRFPNLTSTEVYSGIDTGKYSLTLVFDPKHRKELEAAIVTAGGGKGKSPLKEIPSDAQYDAGMLMLKAKSRYEVSAIDASNNDIDLSEISMGSEVQVQLSFQEYTQGGGGVTCYLGKIRLLKKNSNNDFDFGDLPEGYEPGTDDLDDPLPF